ncbi:MAG: Ig-like domain-containing protein [Monoglobaceae bacterium]
MKKTIIFTLLTSLIISVFGINGFAADFKRIDMYYDFNNYTGIMGQGVAPDENWGIAYMQNKDGSYVPSDKRKAFGSAKDDETNSGVMRINGTGEPVLLFDGLIKEGAFHISFDIKLNAVNSGLYIGFYDSFSYPSDDTRTLESTYSIGPWIRSDKKVRYVYKGDKSGNDMRYTQHWGNKLEDNAPEVVENRWYHMDMYFGDYGSNDTAIAKYYIDGQLVNNNDVYFSGCKGFKGLYFRSESADFYIDNLYVSNFKGDEYLHGFLENEIIGDDNSIKLKLSEPLENSITANDIKIVYASTGEAINDFEVTSDSSVYADIVLNGKLKSGRYNVILKDSAVGAFYGKPMQEAVTFRTQPRYVNGVECPDVEKVSYKNYDGKEQKPNNGISTATPSIDVLFSTAVADKDIMDNIKLICDGSSLDYTYKISEDKKTISIEPENVFEPEKEYLLSVSGNICADVSDIATMGIDYSEAFTTLNDPMFAIAAEDIETEGTNAYFKVKVIKTSDNEDGKYTYAIAAYKKHIVTGADGTEKTYLEMMSLNRFPVVFAQDEKGITILGDEPINIEGADECGGYMWKYPNNTAEIVKLLELN